MAISLASLVKAKPLKKGDTSDAVLLLQERLTAAGYRVGQDKVFGPGTDSAVRRFQAQQGLVADGIVGPKTAALLDGADGTALIDRAHPIQTATGWPHDDTASLIAFYGDPRSNLEAWKRDNVVTVPCPWSLYYEGKLWSHPVQFHKRAAHALAAAFASVWEAAGQDDKSPILKHVRNFSGSGEFRVVRDGSRLSCHAFWAAIDFDAEHLPIKTRVDIAIMPPVIVTAFKSNGAFWGNEYQGRPDPMHFQWAHE